MKPTVQQQEVIGKLSAFLGNDDKFFNLSGPAGVGKTFVVQYLIDSVLVTMAKFKQAMGISNKYKDVALLATTNKAAAELGSSINREVLTVHKFFGQHLRIAKDLFAVFFGMHRCYMYLSTYCNQGSERSKKIQNLPTLRGRQHHKALLCSSGFTVMP